MGCGSCCAQFFLVFFNTIFIILGLVFVAAGALIKLGSQLLTQAADNLLKSIPSIPKSMGLNATDINQHEGVQTALNIGNVSNSLAIALIVLGVFVFLMGCFGCCGACCKVVPLLVIYIVIVSIIAVGQAVLVGLLFSGKFDSEFQRAINVTLVRFKGIDEMDANSLLWNVGQISIGCCGITNYTNFHYATKWKRTRSFGNIPQTLVTPISCCKFNGTWPQGKPLSRNCASAPTPGTSNYNMPCWNKVMKFLEQYKWPVLGACCGEIALQVLMVVFATIIICEKRYEGK